MTFRWEETNDEKAIPPTWDEIESKKTSSTFYTNNGSCHQGGNDITTTTTTTTNNNNNNITYLENLSYQLLSLTKARKIALENDINSLTGNQQQENKNELSQWLSSTCSPPHWSINSSTSLRVIKDNSMSPTSSFFDRINLELPLVVAVENNMLQRSAKDQSEHQIKRDVERDIILLNGEKRLKGSSGFNNIMSVLANTMHNLVKEISFSRKEKSEEISKEDMLMTYKFFAMEILKAVNRTNSGGVSFDILNKLLQENNEGGDEVIVPDSKKADPLVIKINTGPYKNDIHNTEIEKQNEKDDEWGWGFRVEVEAATMYNIYDASMENILSNVKACYTNKLFLPISCIHSREKRIPITESYISKDNQLNNRIASSVETVLKTTTNAGIQEEKYTYDNGIVVLAESSLI